jgi:hypothetical protein
MTVANRILFAVVLCSFVATGPAFGQGRSDSAPGKQQKNASIASPATSTSSTSAPASSANAAIYYGSWLDDASVVEPGDVWVGLSTGYWKADASRQYDVPVVSAAVGLNRRMQAGGSLSMYHFQDGTGLSDTGVGNMSVYGKLVLIDASTTQSGFGVAIAPLVEFSPSGEDQLGWAIPVNIESRRAQARIYGSAGYFSRGAIFATIAAQVPMGDRVSLSGNFGQSYASAGTHQTAIGVGAAFMMTATSGVFVGVGQTFQPIELGPGGVSFGGGVSFLLPKPQKP